MKTSYEIGTTHFNKEVRVYRNLTRKCFSIQHKTDKGWRVLGHCIGITLSNATFVVSTAGRERVRREGKKYVHAYVRGKVVVPNYIFWDAFSEGEQHSVSYNPYLDDFFVYADGGLATGTHLAVVDLFGVRVSK